MTREPRSFDFARAAAALIFLISLSGPSSRLRGEETLSGLNVDTDLSVETGSYLSFRLACVIIDAATGEGLAGRCGVVDCEGVHSRPEEGAYLYRQDDLGGTYFYSHGGFSVTVPAGATEIRVSHGHEYYPYSATIEVVRDTCVSVELERVLDMNSSGWFSGDIHAHIAHAWGDHYLEPTDAHLIARAEGLNVINCLDNDYQFTGGPDPCSTTDCYVYMNEEFRSNYLGHMGILGLTAIVDPTGAECAPMTMDIADMAHEQPGALVVSAHPITTERFWEVDDWAGSGLARELPVDAVKGKIDALEVMSYSNYHSQGVELDFWYSLLNTGIHIAACAGTDAVMNLDQTNPPGEFRTYAKVEDEKIGYFNWLDAIRRGETFVTNGPLIYLFEVDDYSSGDTCYTETAFEADCRLSLASPYPMDRAEIVLNGDVVETIEINGGGTHVDTSFSLQIEESSWIAARVYGENGHWQRIRDWSFAHTSPVYFFVNNEPVREAEDVYFMINWIKDLERLVRTYPGWHDPADSLRFFNETAEARLYYRGLLTATGIEDEGFIGGTLPFLMLRNSPNPFSGNTTIEFEFSAPNGYSYRVDPDHPGEGLVCRCAVYDVQGRLIKILYKGGMEAGIGTFRWDGTDARGREVGSGVYFCRLDINGASVRKKMVLIR